MVHLKNFQCTYNGLINLHELSTIRISNKKSFQMLLKSRNRFRILDFIKYNVNCSRFSVHNTKMSYITGGTCKRKSSNEQSK